MAVDCVHLWRSINDGVHVCAYCRRTLRFTTKEGKRLADKVGRLSQKMAEGSEYTQKLEADLRARENRIQELNLKVDQIRNNLADEMEHTLELTGMLRMLVSTVLEDDGFSFDNHGMGSAFYDALDKVDALLKRRKS